MKRILIIGATSSIATACARLWAARGEQIFLVARNEAKLHELAADLEVRGAAAVSTCRLDVTDTSAYADVLDAARQTLGQIDVALIAHGTLPDQLLCQLDRNLALREFHINATSVIALLTVLANQFEEQGFGGIAVISSVAGDRGRPSNYVYGSAKAAVSVFCEGLRARLFKSGVSLTDIRPGFVDTPMTEGLSLPTALVAQPEQVADRILSGIERKVDVLYAPAFWRVVMAIICMIPRFVFKRISL